MAAVQAGDMRTAKKMVLDVARKAGYKIVAYHGADTDNIRIFSGNPDRLESTEPNLIFIRRESVWEQWK